MVRMFRRGVGLDGLGWWGALYPPCLGLDFANLADHGRLSVDTLGVALPLWATDLSVP